jgi:hypothetical protein
MQRASARPRGVDSTVRSGAGGFRPIPRDQPQPGASLAEILRFFLAKPSPVVIATTFVVAAATRVLIGSWGWWDLVIPLVVVALEPFTEWLIHVHVLHRKPTRIGRFTIDPVTARKHRDHHRNPKDLRIVMVPYQALVPALVLAGAVAVLLEPKRAAMVIASGFGMLLWYEWVHYLIHSPYRPRSTWFRNLSRNHIKHHFKNEHYWFGVTVSLGDRVLGTKPDEASVDVSPTVRTLGVE